MFIIEKYKGYFGVWHNDGEHTNCRPLELFISFNQALRYAEINEKRLGRS